MRNVCSQKPHLQLFTSAEDAQRMYLAHDASVSPHEPNIQSGLQMLCGTTAGFVISKVEFLRRRFCSSLEENIAILNVRINST
jgi:hypothetical protein